MEGSAAQGHSTTQASSVLQIFLSQDLWNPTSVAGGFPQTVWMMSWEDLMGLSEQGMHHFCPQFLEHIFALWP